MIKNDTLKHLSRMIGTAVTGTKQSLIDRLSMASRDSVDLANKRIISIDMGIRNLSACVVFVPARKRSQNFSIPFIESWQRETIISDKDEKDALINEANNPSSDAASSLFHPAVLSQIAFKAFRRILDDNEKADIILIERQRLRSASSSNVLEWALRVNMLESMLYAFLTTLYLSYGSIYPQIQEKSHPLVVSVIPARMAQFWLSSSTQSKRLTGTASKQARIKLVSQMIGRMGSVNPVVQGNDQLMQSTFQSEKKKDDLSDSLLQAMAWIRWQENREILSDYDLSQILINKSKAVSSESIQHVLETMVGRFELDKKP